jgi:phosphoglycolate phosphatase
MLPIVFDLDGTLIDSLPEIAEAANGFLAEQGHAPLPIAQIGGFVGRGEAVFLERLMRAADMDLARFDALRPRFTELYVEASRRTRLFAGVPEMLADFRARGVPLGLCTNKPSGPLRAALEAASLTETFGVVVAGDSLPERKPHPAPLRFALERLGAATGLYVGDSEVDAETAERAGVPFALFTEGIRSRPLHEIPHDIAFSDFAALAGIHAAMTDRADARA